MSGNNIFSMSQEMRQQIDWINKVLKGADNESVVIGGIVKPTISRDIKEQYAAIKALVVGRDAFKTKAEMVSSGSPSSGAVLAEVWNDGERDNNGLYGWNGSAWEKSPYDNTDALKAELDASNAMLTDGYRAAMQKLEQTGVSGGNDTAIDVIDKADLDALDSILAAVTDEHGNMLEGWNQNGEKIVPVVMRLLKDLVLKNTRLIDGTYNYANAVSDESGNVAFGVDQQTGQTLAALMKLFGPLEMGKDATVISGEYNWDFALVDESGNIGFGFMNGILMTPDTVRVESESIRDNRNVTLSNQVKSEVNSRPALPVWDYNHLIVYGQSLSTGMEGWPRLSKTPFYGNKMLGDCVRPVSVSGADWTPVGGVSEFLPLESRVQDGAGRVLTDAEVATLPPGNGAQGETPTEGWVNMAKWLHNRHLITNNDPRVFVGANLGVPGRTIEQLSKGASPELYQRFYQGITQAKAVADTESKSYGVSGICWLQGEYNYWDQFGGTDTRTGYLEKLKTLRTDMVADVKTVTGQQDSPAFFTYQTGAAYSRDHNDLAIGMAQWDFAREVENAYLVGPVYPYSDKGGHLDSNGYRWYGNLIAKVYHRVVTLGQNWRPLSPLSSQQAGKQITIDFYVPEPPLQFAFPYVNSTPTEYANKGFRVSDSQGDVRITEVEIVGQTMIRLSLEREPEDGAKLWYADKTKHNGNGNVCDSDQSLAHDLYEYHPDSGQYPSADKPELNDKPYPLNNWLIAFCIPTNWSE